MKMRATFFVALLYLISCTLYSTSVVAQKRSFSLAVRIPLQVDWQNAEIRNYPNGPTSGKNATAFNWGLDILAEKEITRNLSLYGGVGYFRDRFNIRRSYDHQLLNIGTDSLPIGTAVHHYTYHLFRVPIDISYKIIRTKKFDIQLGLEYILNYVFRQVYNGVKPFANANNQLSEFRYFGNSIMFLTQFSKVISSTSSIQLEPYIRILNSFKSDPILYENANGTHERTFDSFGLAIKFIFSSKRN